MAVNIKIKVDVDKAVEKSLDNITKRLEGVSKGMESIVKKMEVGFKGVGDGLNDMLMKLADVDSLGGLKQVEQAMMLLQTAFKNNKITLEQYLPLMDKLTAKYNELSVSATKAASSTKTGGSLPTDAINAAKNGGMINFIDKMDATNLQQIISLSKQELGLVSTVGQKRERLAKQLELSKSTLKNMTLTDRQRAEIADKQLRVEEKKTQQLEKQAVAARRANATDQFDYAMGMQSNTLTQIIAKTNELKIAKDNLNKSDKTQAEQIKIVNRELEQLKIKEDQINKSGLSLVDTNQRASRSFSDLARMAGAYFSVYAVKNLALEMANVTGEFDLQRRSLQALLQDRQAADAIFEKIKATAVQSPFSVMQLTSATKQLAAYRIEADNLFDTTMMLSDISAGLGVEMERLILAFGQVKAASVLRGQEVRQFTESGLPIISLLAQKFSELENRVVSTGEVFDKISNRLVPFEMINEIFQDMTSNGGIFFEMQKIQAETIKGKIVNLTDAYQIFLDKMGSANSGIIKGFIGLLEGMFRNMDSILPVLKGLVAGLITYKTVLFALNIAAGQNVIINKIKTLGHIREAMALGQVTKATVGATLAANGLNAAFYKMILTNPWVGLATLVVGVATAIGLAAYNAGKFNRELEKIERDGLANYTNLYSTYKKLAAVIADNNKSLEEQNAAYNELERTFKDILPKKYLIRQALNDETIAYNEVSAAIYAKIKAQTEEKKLTALNEKYADNLAKKEEALAKAISNRYKISIEQAQGYVLRLKEELDTTGNYTEFLKKLGIGTSKYGIDFTAGLSFEINSFIKEYSNFSYKFKEITENTFANADTSFADFGKELGELRKRATDEVNKFTKQLQDSKTAEEYSANILRIGRAYNRAIKEAMEAPETEQRNVLIAQLEEEQKAFIESYTKRSIMANRMKELAKQYGIASESLMMFLRTENESSDEWGSKVLETIEKRAEQVKRYNTAADAEKPNIIANIEAYNNETKALVHLAKIYGYTKDAKNSSANSKDPLLNAIKEEISLIEKLTNQYKLLIKEGKSANDAKTIVGDSFKENIDNINKILTKEGLEPLKFDDLFQGDPNAILNLFTKQLEKLKGNKEASKLLSEQIGDLKVKIEIENLDDIENNLKTTLENIVNRRALSLEINDAPEASRSILMAMFGISEKDMLSDIGNVITEVNDAIRNGFEKIGGGISPIADFTKLTTEQFNKLLDPFRDKEKYGDIADQLIKMFEFIQKEQKSYITQTGKAYGELLKVYDEYNQRIIAVEQNKVRELKELDNQYYIAKLKQDANYFQLKQAIENKAAKETAKIRYEELKNSEEYINLFDRIEILSEDNLITAYNKVRTGIVDAFKSGTITLKEFQRSLSELDKQFQSFYQNTSNFVSFLKGGFDELFNKITQTGQNIESISADISKFQDTQDPVKFASTLGKDKIQYLRSQGIDIMKIFTQSGGKMGQIATTVGKVGQGLSGVASKAAGTIAVIDTIFQNIYKGIKATEELFNSIKEYRESINASDEKTTTNWEKFMTNFGKFNEDTISWWNKLKSGDLAGGISGIITSWIGLITNFNKLGDQQIQENIDKTTTSIDRLNDSLDRLQTQVDKQLGSDWLSGMNQIAEGYAQMAEDTQANIDNMKSMKNPDEDEIYAEEQKLLDAQEKYQETIDAMVEEMTGADLKSAAEDFAQIWIDAFLAGEDAMAAIEDRFDEMIKNMIVKALMSKTAAKILEKTFKLVEDAVDDGEVTQAEIEGINAEGERAVELMNTVFSGMGDWFKEMLGAGGSGETLQKGIQGVTEQTAGIIEGYLNTIRFEIFKHTNVLQGIQTQMQMNNNISSDILYQATLSYQVLVAIRDWQNSITTLDNGLPAIRVV